MRVIHALAAAAAFLSVLSLTAAESAGPQPKPVITAAGVANAAGYTAGVVSPGEILVIFGTDIGPATLVTLETSGPFVTTALGDVRVRFDGVPAPLVYVSATQVSAVAPYALEGKATTMMALEFLGVVSGPIELPVAASVPGIFTAHSSGMGQAAALNQDGSVNSPDNPAAPGDIVVLFATGDGQTMPAGQDGLIVDPAGVLPKPNLGVRVYFDQEGEVLYAGAAPALVSGVLQVNARIPVSTSNDLGMFVSLTVGEAESQRGVTVAVAVRPKPLPPGGSVMLLPATLTGNPELAATVIGDALLPFEIRNAAGAVVLTGAVQDRVTRSTITGNLIFAPIVRNLADGGSGAKVVGVSKSGFAGLEVRVAYRVDASGDVGLPAATRSADGDRVRFELERPLGPPEDSLPPAIVTSATASAMGGEIVIDAALEDGTPVSVTIPGAQAPQ
jgi:uncharacterized protein (TIGR03437 family)